MIVGVLSIVLAFLCNVSSAFIWVYVAIATIAAFAPMVYSYLYYRKHGNSEEETEE